MEDLQEAHQAFACAGLHLLQLRSKSEYVHLLCACGPAIAIEATREARENELHEHGAMDQGLVFLRVFFNKNCNVSVPSNKCHVLLSA